MDEKTEADLEAAAFAKEALSADMASLVVEIRALSQEISDVGGLDLGAVIRDAAGLVSMADEGLATEGLDNQTRALLKGVKTLAIRSGFLAVLAARWLGYSFENDLLRHELAELTQATSVTRFVRVDADGLPLEITTP